MILHEEQSDLDTPTGAMRTYVYRPQLPGATPASCSSRRS